MNALAKVVGFGAGLAVVCGVAWAAGTAVGPVAEEPEAHEERAMTEDHPMTAEHAMGGDEVALPGGLAVAQDGYRLVLDDDVLTAGTQPLTFTVLGPDGEPVTAYDVEHERRLHLIAVRRDVAGYQHVHPVLDLRTGRWSTELELTPGSWRVFADFAPTGGEPLTLGSDLLIPGEMAAPAPAPVTRTATVDGYTVTVSGDLVAGEHSMLAFTVEKDGVPVTDDLQPYLGAQGHLVALREGDLAYLHVHPEDGLEFGAEVPSPGRYHLFLDFRHGGVVRTAGFVLEAS